ncbi:MAG: type III polyketide synthase, partial [Singulisphaera sp.]
MTVAIAGIGTAAPEHLIEQNDAAEQAAKICCQTAVQQRLVRSLYRRAGVRTRHSVVLDSDTNGRPAEQSFYTRSAQGPSTAERMEAYEKHAAPLAVAAAREALENSDVTAAEIG